MKAELLKRFFRAIASSDQEAIDKLTYLVIDEERSKGHTLLADQLENITKKNQKEKSTNISKPASSRPENLQALTELPTSKRFNLPLVTIIPRDNLRYHAATNLNKSLDTALWRRFDDLIAVPKPGEQELEFILKETLSAIEVGSINWPRIIEQMRDFSAAQAVRVAQDAAKRAILEREELVIQEHLEEAIAEIKVS